MRTKTAGYSCVVVAAALLLAPTRVHAATLTTAGTVSATHYQVTWLGGTDTVAAGIDGGLVVGTIASADGGSNHSFRWTAAEGMVDLGTPPGVSSVVVRGVSKGQIVGYSQGQGPSRAFQWSQATGWSELPKGDCFGVQAMGISDDLIAGICVTSDAIGAGVSRAVLWTNGAGPTDIGTLGGRGADAWGVKGGLVVGQSQVSATVAHAYLWNGSMIDLGALPDVSIGYGVDSGIVVGGTSSINGDSYPFVWTPGAGMVELPLAGAQAYAVSNGQVVGGGSGAAFSWTAAGGLVDLSPIVGEAIAYDVKQGQIVGGGRHNGQLEAFLLTPTNCGDGVTQESEQCDDGNTDNTDFCKNDCTLAVCGDGYTQSVIGEQCDDGNLVALDGCDASCQRETVVASTVGAGGTLTGSAATVTSPVAGAVSIIETSHDSTAPAGFSFLGRQIVLHAPTATAAQPLQLVFRIPAASLPAGVDETNVQITKDGAQVPDCTGTNGVASPNPCVSTRAVLPGGDPQLTVLSATASVWNVNAPLCGGNTIAQPKLTITKLNTLPGDDSLSFAGSLTLPTPVTPALNPLANGIRLVLQNAGASMLDLTIPGGAYADPPRRGWTANKAGTTWTYQDKSAAPAKGIYQVTVHDESKKTPGLVNITLKGKKGGYGVAPETLPVWGEVAFAPPGQQCGVVEFSGPAPAPTCTFNKARSTLTCK